MLRKDRINELFKERENGKNKRRSLLLTLGIVTGLCVAFTILGFKTPLPLPEEEGQFVLLGADEFGQDAYEPEPVQPEKETVEPEQREKPETPEQPETPEPEQAEPDPLETGNEDDAPEITKPEDPKPESSPETQPEKEPETEPEKEPEKPKNRFTFDKDKFGKGDKGQDGDQGVKDGEENTLGKSYTYKKTEYGSVGVVGGSGRGFIDMPKINDDSQENADVFVKVTVDRNGKVLEARIDYKKTTTTNPVLIQKALTSAKNAVFAKMSGGPQITEELLKYEYRLE